MSVIAWKGLDALKEAEVKLQRLQVEGVDVSSVLVLVRDAYAKLRPIARTLAVLYPHGGAQ